MSWKDTRSKRYREIYEEMGASTTVKGNAKYITNKWSNESTV